MTWTPYEALQRRVIIATTNDWFLIKNRPVSTIRLSTSSIIFPKRVLDYRRIPEMSSARSTICIIRSSFWRARRTYNRCRAIINSYFWHRSNTFRVCTRLWPRLAHHHPLNVPGEECGRKISVHHPRGHPSVVSPLCRLRSRPATRRSPRGLRRNTPDGSNSMRTPVARCRAPSSWAQMRRWWPATSIPPSTSLRSRRRRAPSWPRSKIGLDRISASFAGSFTRTPSSWRSTDAPESPTWSTVVPSATSGSPARPIWRPIDAGTNPDYPTLTVPRCRHPRHRREITLRSRAPGARPSSRGKPPCVNTSPLNTPRPTITSAIAIITTLESMARKPSANQTSPRQSRLISWPARWPDTNFRRDHYRDDPDSTGDSASICKKRHFSFANWFGGYRNE